jgi:hypothetical protein
MTKAPNNRGRWSARLLIAVGLLAAACTHNETQEVQPGTPADSDPEGDGADDDAGEASAGDGDGDAPPEGSHDAGAADAALEPQPADDGGPQGEPTFAVYLGSTHAHTEYSFDAVDMGGGSPADAFAAAKAAGADFYITTDHVDQMYGDDAHTPEQFQQAKEMAEAATDASFVAIAGFEFHLDENEMNTFGLDLTRDIHELSWNVSPVEYLDFLSDFPETISQWNHPGRKESEFDQFAGHSPERDGAVSLLELLNGEDEVYDTSYQTALDAGWHVSPTAGHDTHDDARFAIDPRTGVLAESLSRESLFEAFRQRRTFASQDPALKVWYHLNGAVMGSIIPLAANYQATVRVEGGQGATLIELVGREGEVVASGEPTDGVWSSELTGEGDSFFYVRITGTDGAMTWTAPVWTSGS